MVAPTHKKLGATHEIWGKIIDYNRAPQQKLTNLQSFRCNVRNSS